MGSATCSPCPVGTYTDVPGMPVCIPCPNGTYASSTGSTFCRACSAGSVSGWLRGVDYHTWDATTLGYFSSASCMPCPAGFSQPLPAQVWRACGRCGRCGRVLFFTCARAPRAHAPYEALWDHDVSRRQRACMLVRTCKPEPPPPQPGSAPTPQNTHMGSNPLVVATLNPNP
eukprot:190964-Chlamydomonas_euryale.AAC.1